MFLFSCEVSAEKSGDKKMVESSTKFFQTKIRNIDTGRSVFLKLEWSLGSKNMLT